MSVPVSAEIVVAGAGIIGCAITYELTRRGYGVEVFDTRTIGSGATRASAGILAPFIHAPSPQPLQDLTLESFRMYDAFVADVRSDSQMDVEYRRCGTLEIPTSDEDSGRLTALADRARAAGLTADWRKRGLFIHEQGYVRVEHLMDALRRAAEQRGAIFHEGEPIVRVDPKQDRVIVETKSRQKRCGAVVLAAGSWAGILGFEPLEVRPVRGQLLRVRWPKPIPSVLWAGDFYIVPWLDGSLLVGATQEEVGFDERVTAGGVALLLAALNRILPESGDATFLEARAGLRPGSADDLPVIRPSVRSPRVIHATGHYRNGVLLAPLTARKVSDLVAEVSPKR